MKDGTFEAYGSRDYEYVTDGVYVSYGDGSDTPVPTTPTPDYEKDISQLKQDVHQLKTALKAIMDLLGRQSNHPLY